MSGSSEPISHAQHGAHAAHMEAGGPLSPVQHLIGRRMAKSDA